MTNDPALLTYTKDFLEGTADLSVEEFGAYTRLIFHQHQRWTLPNNEKKLARLAGCSLPEFREIWKEINTKFTLSENSEFYNERCRKEMVNRANNARLKSILAVYGNWLKHNKRLTKQQKQEVKNQFSTVQFLDIENDDERKDKIIKHLKKLSLEVAKRPHYIGNGNEDVNVIEVLSAYEYLKKHDLQKIESFEMRNKKSFKNYDQFLTIFNNKVITEGLEFESKILLARLEMLNVNWNKEEIKAMDNAVIEKLKQHD